VWGSGNSGDNLFAVGLGAPLRPSPDFCGLLPAKRRAFLGGLQMKAVLTVDDSPSIRQMVKLVLSQAGFEVHEAADGVEGLEKAKAKPVQMIVTDLNMPRMDGITLVRELRQLPAYKGVPIILLTTESDESFKKKAKDAGATGWITKPFKQEQLIAVAQKVLGK
jgi:two-component system chemotaxis response regulator CheY